MSGDVTLYEPGARVSVNVVADSNGDVARRGQLVEIVGQSKDRVEVALCGTRGAAVGHLLRDPMHEADRPGSRTSLDDVTFESGDEVGESKLGLRHYVDWFETDDGTLGPGDDVVSAAGGGVGAFNGDTDDASDLMGVVWTTHGRASHTAGKVAVVRHK